MEASGVGRPHCPYDGFVPLWWICACIYWGKCYPYIDATPNSYIHF